MTFLRSVKIASLACSIFFNAGGCYAAEAADAASADVEYRQAIAEARAGRAAEANLVLGALAARFPERQDIAGDYAVVLGWAGDHAGALRQMDRIDTRQAPAYVIEGLANSARRLQRFDLANTLWLQVQARFPDRVEAQVGRVPMLIEAGRLEEASLQADRLRGRYPQRIDVLEVWAEAADARRDYFGSLGAYEAILAIDPGHRMALRGKIHTLSLLGAPQLAVELADRNPGALLAGERDVLGADRTAQRIRWGAVAADIGQGEGRFSTTDSALGDSEAAGARAMDPAAELSQSERTLALDRVIALRDRFRMREAVALYQALAARREVLPAYVKSAAASAYLYLEQPESARELYAQALSTEPDDLNSRLGLFYALAESERHDEALREVENAVAATPQWIGAWSPESTLENPAYPRVLAARSMAPLFANRTGEAYLRLHDLSGRAPYNMEIRADYASVMRARGWPRLAEEELRWVLAADPNNSGALGEHAGALLEMRDYRASETALAAARAVDAQDGRVVRAGRLAQVHDMRELIVESSYGKSGGGPFGTRDQNIEAWLYSSPLAYQYRAFGHLYTAQASFENGTAKRERSGLGLEYRSPKLVASGELFEDRRDSRTGAAIALAYMPDDFWTLRAGADSSTNETPLQARLAGIRARQVSAELQWRAHESRRVSLSVDVLDFSDGNRREATQVSWTERMISGPVYALEVTASLYASRNSLAGAPYFNPSSDFSPSLEFSNEWLQWRRYTRSFLHRLIVTVGRYRQESFETKPLSGLRYEQEWKANDRLDLRYGIGRGLHPYDGAQTARNYAYLSLNWRF